MSNKSQVLSLYKSLLKESSKFTSYNFREYAQRRVKAEFVKNKQVTDTAQQAALVAKAQSSLQSLKRQVVISQLYPAEKSVVETKLHQ